MPSIQKKIRDLERVLKKKGNASDTAALQARLADLQQANTQNVQSDKDKKLSIKYHMVKFVERKKLTRKIRNVDTKLKGSLNEKDHAALQRQRQALEEDLAYVMYFPRSSKYVALFADNDDEKNTAKAAATAEASAARLAAYAARQADVDSGAVDRVQHAINVEYGIETEGFDPSKAVVTRVRPAVSVTAATNGKANTQKQKQALAKLAAKAADTTVVLPPSAPSAKEELDIFGAGDGAVDDSSSSSDSDSDSDGDSDRDNDNDNAEKPAKKSKTEAAAAHAAPALDDFFAEEAAELPESAAPEPGKVKHDTSGKYHERVKGVAHMGDNGSKKGGGVRAGAGGKGGSGGGASSKPLHKQEARLQKWQADRKNRAHVPQMSVRQAREFSGEGGGAAAAGGAGGVDMKGKAGGAGKAGSSRDAPQVGGKRGREQVNKDQNDKRALWERAGGLSAAAVTEGTIQKNKGAIQKSSGKKIVFD